MYGNEKRSRICMRWFVKVEYCSDTHPCAACGTSGCHTGGRACGTLCAAYCGRRVRISHMKNLARKWSTHPKDVVPMYRYEHESSAPCVHSSRRVRTFRLGAKHKSATSYTLFAQKRLEGHSSVIRHRFDPSITKSPPNSFVRPLNALPRIIRPPAANNVGILTMVS